MENLNNSSLRLNIPETLESIRLEKRLSKAEFANRCNISASFYSEILHKKKSLNIETLEKICINIEVPIEVFIFKAINENEIKDEGKRKLIREIRPLMNEISNILYNEEFIGKFKNSESNFSLL